MLCVYVCVCVKQRPDTKRCLLALIFQSWGIESTRCGITSRFRHTLPFLISRMDMRI